MAGPSTWWRKFGTALAALVLTVLAFGPSLDAIVCHDEGGGLAAAAAEMPGVLVSDPAPIGDHPDDGGVCIHGHCHHPSPYVPTTLIASAEPKESSARHALARVSVPTSDLKFGLKRPPRG